MPPNSHYKSIGDTDARGEIQIKYYVSHADYPNDIHYQVTLCPPKTRLFGLSISYRTSRTSKIVLLVYTFDAHAKRVISLNSVPVYIGPHPAGGFKGGRTIIGQLLEARDSQFIKTRGDFFFARTVAEFRTIGVSIHGFFSKTMRIITLTTVYLLRDWDCYLKQ